MHGLVSPTALLTNFSAASNPKKTSATAAARHAASSLAKPSAAHPGRRRREEICLMAVPLVWYPSRESVAGARYGYTLQLI